MSTTPNNTPLPDYGEPWRVMTYAYGGVGTREARPIIEDLRLSHRAVACVNACAGLADPAAHLAAMKEAINELQNIANANPSTWGEMADQFLPWAQNRARHALTKLQPFLK